MAAVGGVRRFSRSPSRPPRLGCHPLRPSLGLRDREIGELLIGFALIGAALVLQFGWERVSMPQRRQALLATALASLAGIVVAVNFHLANGASHPWLIPADGFDEGVDLDSLLPAIQLVLAAVSGRLWWLARSERAEESSARQRVHAAA